MMDCGTFALLLDVPEREWTAEQRREMEAHALGCEACARELRLRRTLRAMDDEEPLPEGFAQSWREEIRKEEKRMSNGRFQWKKGAAIAAALVLTAAGTAASYRYDWGSGDAGAAQTAQRSFGMQEETGSDNNYASPMALEFSALGSNMKMSATADSSAAQKEAKIVRTVDFTLKTQRFEEDYAALQTLAQQAGGWVESLNTSGEGTADSLRYANITLRIPSERLDEFVGGARQIGTLSAYSETSDDVSETYYDTQARLDTQKAKMERLQALMDQAQSASELIELENAISETQYMIDSYTGQINRYDSRINESYVYVTLREISPADAAQARDLSLGERMGNALRASLRAAGRLARSFVVFVIAALPYLAVAALVGGVIALLIKKHKKR